MMKYGVATFLSDFLEAQYLKSLDDFTGFE